MLVRNGWPWRLPEMQEQTGTQRVGSSRVTAVTLVSSVESGLQVVVAQGLSEAPG